MSTPKSKTIDTTPRGLAGRPLLDDGIVQSVTVLFKVLANPHRLRMLHAIERNGELSVGEIADQVAMSIQAVSNQLQRLTDQGIVVARRDGNRSYYRIIDPCVTGVLELGICLVEETPPARRP